MSEEDKGTSREELILERLRRRTNPSTLGQIITDIHPVQVKRQTAWMKIHFKLDKATKPILDKHGITGVIRPIYFDYPRSLWKFLSKYPESVWDRYIEAIRYYYINAHQLKPEVIDELTTATVKVIKELFSEVGVEEVGGKETGSGDSSQALGEAGASGTEDRNP
jgi:hypothetical protein